MSKVRVAYIGDSPKLHTGFGNVANAIMSRWSKDFEVHVLGVMQDFIPSSIEPYESFTPVCRHDMMGFGAAMDFVKRVNPDVCFFIGDPGTLRNRFNKFLGSGRMGILPFVTYFPIEGAPLNPAFRDQAQMVALPVTYTKWGAGLLKNFGVDADYVWHGFDHAPFEKYDEERKETLRRLVGWEDKFVIGMIGVNKRVNRQPVMIEVAKILKDRGHNNFVIYLHCGGKGEPVLAGWELGWLINTYGVKEHVILKPSFGDHPNIGRPAQVDNPERLLMPLTEEEKTKNLGSLSFIDILNLFDLYVDPASAHGFNLPCFTPDTIITTRSGIKSISEVPIGELVLTHTGDLEHVTQIYETAYRGKMYHIDALGCEVLKATPDHPILAISRRSNDRNGRVGARNSKPEWLFAEDLKAGDYLCVPKRKVKSARADRLDLAQFCPDAIVEDDYIYYKMGYSPNKVGYGRAAKMFDVSKWNIRQIVAGKDQHVENYDEIKAWIEDNYVAPRRVRYPRYVSVDQGFMRLLGYYVAEGCAGSGFIDFAFHVNETEYHDDVSVLIDRFFDKGFSSTISGNKFNMKISGKPLVNLFSALCGRLAGNKRIPFFITISDELIEQFVVGAWRGDGGKSKDGFRYTTVSETLAYQMRDILLRVGFFASLRRKDRGSEGKGIEFTLSITGKQAIEFEKIMGLDYRSQSRTGQNFWLDDNYVYSPILKIDVREYDGLVYNLEVENAESYTANSIAAHNCGEAARCGVPIITVNDGYARSEIYGDVAHMVEPTAYDYWHTGAHLPLVSPQKLADEIELMMNDGELRERVANRCKDKFDKVTWDDAATLFTEKIELAHEFGKEIAMVL